MGGSIESGGGRGLTSGSPGSTPRHGSGASSTPGHSGRASGITALTHSKSRIGNKGLVHGGLGIAGRVISKRARLVSADALVLGALGLDNGGLGGATVVEERAQSFADGLNVRCGDSEGGSGESDLLNEVAHLEGVEDHEPGKT